MEMMRNAIEENSKENKLLREEVKKLTKCSKMVENAVNNYTGTWLMIWLLIIRDTEEGEV